MFLLWRKEKRKKNQKTQQLDACLFVLNSWSAERPLQQGSEFEFLLFLRLKLIFKSLIFTLQD